MRTAGLDEAALGPRLGPFCAALVQTDCSRTALEGRPDVYSMLQGAVSRHAPGRAPDSPEPTVIGDSKSLYSPRRGIALLEEGVLILLRAMGTAPPESLRSWVGAFCPPEDAAALNRAPWFADCSDVSIPIACRDQKKIDDKSRALLQALHSAGLNLLPPRQRFVTAAAFNRALQTHGGKSPAVRSIINPLIVHALRSAGPDRRWITVDRQGGRRYYSDWLSELFPNQHLTVNQETPSYSLYSVGAARIDFAVSADKLHFEVAAASMFAKYLRELGMLHFNRWWNRKAPQIKPTAGYPQDAERFLSQLRGAGGIPVAESTLIRIL